MFNVNVEMRSFILPKACKFFSILLHMKRLFVRAPASPVEKSRISGSLADVMANRALKRYVQVVIDCELA